MADLSRFGKPKADPVSRQLGAPGQLPAIEQPADALLPLDEAAWGRMQHDYYNGRQKGQTTHVEAIDAHFTWMPGYTNVITGWPGHGKTELYLQLLLYRAVFAGKKSAIYSAENMPAEQIYDQLIHALTGQNPDKSWSTCLPMRYYEKAREFIRDHFVVVYPKRGMGRTPAHLLAYFETAIARHDIQHCLLDPWNTVDHSAQGKMGGYEPYLIHALGLCTGWSSDTKQSLIITAHPKRLEGMAYGQRRPVPDGSSISGGQTWENMAHVIGAVHRPNKHVEGDTSVELYWHKIKSHKLVGHPGVVGAVGPGEGAPAVAVTFDWQTNRYYFNGWTPLESPIAYAFYGAQWQEPEPATNDLPADFTPHGRVVRVPHNS